MTTLTSLCSYTPDAKMDNNDVHAATINAVALKLPQFYTDNPVFWFNFAEAQFNIQKITADDTKFSHVVCSLPAHVALDVHKLVNNPPKTDKYQAIKSLLLKEFSLSSAERARLLLDLPGLGDRKPSKLFSYMNRLCEGVEDVAEMFLRELFLRQLPDDIRTHVADKQDLPLEKLVEVTDHFFNNTGGRICGVQTTAARPAAAAGPTAAAATSAVSTHSNLCFYHEKYGDKAKKCRAPCSYKPGN